MVLLYLAPNCPKKLKEKFLLVITTPNNLEAKGQMTEITLRRKCRNRYESSSPFPPIEAGRSQQLDIRCPGVWGVGKTQKDHQSSSGRPEENRGWERLVKSLGKDTFPPCGLNMSPDSFFHCLRWLGFREVEHC